MQLLIVTEVGIQKDYLARSFLFLRAVFYSINNPKQMERSYQRKIGVTDILKRENTVC